MTDVDTSGPRKGINLQRVGDKWARREDVKWFQLWCQFLQLSPSYELARKCRQCELTGDELLPADFDIVLSVYDDLGDVIMPNFVHWWRDVGIRHFGYQGEKPSPSLLGVIRHDSGDEHVSRLKASISTYINESWAEQGEPTAIIAAIPVGLSKAQIAKWIDATLDEHGGKERTGKPSEPTYKLEGKRLHQKSVFQYLRCLLAKSANPDMVLWQIGVKSKLSNTYSDQQARSQQRTYDEAEDRKQLKELTSRALSRGHMIAENAARGVFPLFAKCPHAMPMDWNEAHQRNMKARTIVRSKREPV